MFLVQTLVGAIKTVVPLEAAESSIANGSRITMKHGAIQSNSMA